VLHLALSVFLSLLPRRYRERFTTAESSDLRWGAMVGGLLQALVCLGLFILRYLSFFEYRIGDIGERTIARGAEHVLTAPAAQFGMGFTTTVEYLVQPLTLVLIYFTVEGVVRLTAALVTEEIVGTLPLYIIAWGQERRGAARAERALGPRVPDIVEPMYSPDYDLRIFTCRRKVGWDRMMTVSYDGQFYEVLDEQPGKPPHHFIYRLRKSRPGRLIRTVHQYDPQEVLRKEEAPPCFLASVLGRVATAFGGRRAALAKAPLLPDVVEHLTDGDCQLRIAACRPKTGWDHLMTVEYEDEFYEVAGESPGTPSYPHVYLLRRIPQGKAIRALHHYHPDETLGES
jgi:hypothetical protein